MATSVVNHGILEYIFKHLIEDPLAQDFHISTQKVKYLIKS